MLTCNLHSLTDSDRARQRAVWRKLIPAAVKREVAGGYEFEFSAEHVPLEDIGFLIAAESRCCGFSSLQLEVKAGNKAVFRFLGPEGTRKVLDSQIAVFLED